MSYVWDGFNSQNSTHFFYYLCGTMYIIPFIIKQSNTNNIIFIDKDSGVKESIHFYPPSYVKSISMNGTDRVNFITRDIKDYFRLSIPEDVIKIMGIIYIVTQS